MRIRASAPATLTTSGPRRANPSANAALSVSVKMPLAESSCGFSTIAGIIAASAGAKNVVTVEMKMFSSRIATRFSPTRYSPIIATPRRKFVPTRMTRRSNRST